MKNLIYILMLLWAVDSLSAQIPLVLEGINEIARFQTDLSKNTGGFISFKSSPSDYVGYMGIHPRRPGDIEIGTTLGSTGKVNITIDGDPKLSVDQDGDVIIKNLQGSPNSIPRPVRVGPAGNLSAHNGYNSATVPCNSFVANDADGEFTKVVNPIGTVQFIQHIENTGELSSPISLPIGVSVVNMVISYVNLAQASDGFRIAVHRTPFIPTSADMSERVSGWIVLSRDGSFTGSNSNYMEMAQVNIGVTAIPFEEDFLYSLIVKCDDCPNQYLRSVELNYTF